MKESQPGKLFSDKNRTFLLLFFLLAGLAIQCYWTVQALGDGKFFLTHEDEVIYYCSAKLFADTNAVQAESCIEEKVSLIGNMNWYGPGYHIVYGLLFKIFNHHSATFPWFHVILGLATIATIFVFPIRMEFRLITAIAVLFSHQFNVYKFTYFPENLVFFLATVLTLVLLKVYTSEGNAKRNYYVLFIVLACLFMLLRVSFIFWLAGPIAFAANRGQVIQRTIIFLIAMCISLAYQKFFIAPPWASEMKKIDSLFSLDLPDFIFRTVKSALQNMGRFFTPRSSVLRILFLLVTGAIAVFWFHRSRLVLSALLISGTLILVMAGFYYIDDFYFVKQSGMLIPLLLIGIIAGSKKAWVPYLVVIAMLVTFPSPFRKVDESIETGRAAFQHYTNHRKFESALMQLTHHIGPDSTIILWDYREYDYGYSAQALLPFSTNGKNPIMYTTNIVDRSATAEERFKMHGRLPVGYILSRYPLTLDGSREVYANEYYHLYELQRTK